MRQTAAQKDPINFGELFCGPGGMSLGASLAAADVGLHLKHLWALDNDPSATATYKKHFPDCEVLTTSIHSEDALARLSDVSGATPLNGIAFGFPCNDFSLVGEQKGLSGQYGPLYKYCIEAVRRFDPDWFVAENVGGIRANGALQQILTDFGELEYRLTPHLYRFEQYGLPQRRHRVLIVGIRKSLNKDFRVPAPVGPVVSAKEALEIPPIPGNASNHELTKQSAAVIARLEATKPGENAFNASLPDELRLNVRGARISQIYRRLHPDKPAYTITGSGGGGTHVYHWEEPRALTNRERARLQTFPDWYEFQGGKEAVRRQIGMAVPPEGARVVFAALFRTLQSQDYLSVKPNLAAMLERSLRL